jgi:hypothetical protein
MANIWQKRLSVPAPRADVASFADRSFEASPLASRQSSAHPLDWRRRMSDHIAYALLVYTGLQIFVTMGALKGETGSLLPYLALVILVVAIIPSCRRFETRWNRLSDEQAADPAFSGYYRRDCLVLWLLAIGLPFALTAMFKGLGLMFA